MNIAHPHPETQGPELYAGLSANQRAVVVACAKRVERTILDLRVTDNGSVNLSDPHTDWARKLRRACEQMELYLAAADAVGLSRLVSAAHGFNVPKRVQNARRAYAGSERLEGCPPVGLWRQIGQTDIRAFVGLDTYFWRLHGLVNEVEAMSLLATPMVEIRRAA